MGKFLGGDFFFFACLVFLRKNTQTKKILKNGYLDG